MNDEAKENFASLRPSTGLGTNPELLSKGHSRNSRSESKENFPKKERLLKTKDFEKVYRGGSSFKIDCVILKTLRTALLINRLGFSISSKNISSSCRRNRIRRLFREVYRKNKKALKKSFDMVLVIRRDFVNNFGYQDAENFFLKLAKKAGILL